MSSTRIALPGFDPKELEKLIIAMVSVDGPKWLPRPGTFLYLRPTMIGSAPVRENIALVIPQLNALRASRHLSFLPAQFPTNSGLFNVLPDPSTPDKLSPKFINYRISLFSTSPISHGLLDIQAEAVLTLGLGSRCSNPKGGNSFHYRNFYASNGCTAWNETIGIQERCEGLAGRLWIRQSRCELWPKLDG